MVKETKKNHLAAPDIKTKDLLSQVQFSPDEGQIWLGKNRMLLIHASSFGVLRRELIESTGSAQARILLTRMGYHNGTHDAELASKLKPRNGKAIAPILMGPQLHMLEGTGKVEPVRMSYDEKTGYFDGEYIWQNSAEAIAHRDIYGAGNEAACWMQIGYASGFISRYMGKPILFREVECIAKGDKQCRIIGKPEDQWQDNKDDLEFLRTATTTNRAHSFSTAAALTPQNSSNPLGISGIVGISSGFNAVCNKLRRVADTNATVLFLGESGVGKEVFARGLHKISPRAEKNFIAVNCAAIPENLVEAELFGVEKGAFTDASKTKPGRFERANGGTLFLDEIGILSKTAQGKLLRVIQERELERVGGSKTIPVDIRIVAATNLNLKTEVDAGRFREDLYYRLNVFPVVVPALRDRLEDIPVFINYFLHKYRKLHKRTPTGFTSDAINTLINYHWPGNIRELENVIERCVIMVPDNTAIDSLQLLSDGESFGQHTLNNTANKAQTTAPKKQDKSTMELQNAIKNLLSIPNKPNTFLTFEKLLIDEALALSKGNKSAAARLLGITRSQLVYRLTGKISR